MFRRDALPEFIEFVGEPDDDAAHRWIVDQLETELATTFVDTPLTNAVKGNLGEAITFCIGNEHDFAAMRSKGANYTQCTSSISRPDIDIVWMHFDENAQADHVWLQEVKTTGAATLSLADGLIDDYDKLFDTNPKLTLQTRLASLAAEYRFLALDSDKADRLISILESSLSADDSPHISLVPTVVHQCSSESASTKLLAIRTTLIGRGWGAQKIASWSVRLGDLDARLERLSQGKV
jgi:hypothetical protein